MSSKLSPPPGNKTVLVFGCQCLTFSAEDFLALRETILFSPEYSWALDVLAELPVYYRTATQHLPKLDTIHGDRQLRSLHEWFRTGDIAGETFPPPYIQLAPLLMLTHFTQYEQYLRLTSPGYRDDGRIHVEESEIGEIVGFCIGFLSAAVASAADSREKLAEYASVAVRLSMLLGAIGDAQEVEEEWTSLATVWKRENMEGALNEVLNGFPEAYITVRYDDNRATIMTPRRTMAQLQESLQSASFGCGQVDFNGRYHWYGHKDTVHSLLAMCSRDPSLQLPDASQLVLPTRTNTGGQPVTSGPLTRLVIESILSQQCDWLRTFSAVYESQLKISESIIVEFGQERCVPPTFMRNLRGRVIHFADLNLDLTSRLSPLNPNPRTYDTDIAVIGMACRVAGADDLPEFWNLLCAGTSQHEIMPEARYKDFETPWRPGAQRPWFGNFVRNIDAFDHKFFKKVPREAMSQDPQQRLILQVAYQALEQAGYFHDTNQDKNIGCYVSCCTVDYEHNVNCHTATAYAATGLLRSFMAGKLSHYFGWRGPAFCVDSACSGSAVALHQACQAVLKGECRAALVGGANAIMSPLAFDNLAGASFVSPTGPCKPFDAKADGYCRGEGFAAVYIKKMSDALADGDPILGTIAATAVEQNNNCTPIVVPDAASLAGLFEKVTKSARVLPRDISVVEAHGTGTQAGDPAEYSSVRQTLGGPQREVPLALGSVKGLVGHTEGVSGLIALVKVLMMIHGGMIPPQPNFETLNPYIQAREDDHIEIVKKLKPWSVGFRAALINNYGASGSNASMVLTQAPRERSSSPIHEDGIPFPVRLCGYDEGRLRDYASKLLGYLRDQKTSGSLALSLANVAFNISRQTNPTLDKHALFSCRSIDELETKLQAIAQGDETHFIRAKKDQRSVILCFGGQVSTSVGLDQAVHDAMSLLRRHLDECDSLLQELGYDSIYPGIFSRTPITDQVQLQTQLFALQYSCAKCWIDCGVTVTAVVGHSFGELTALCISGILSLADALTLVARRAALIRDNWGPDSGAMLAVEGEKAEILGLLDESHKAAPDITPATIACFNGPRNFTLAGTTGSIDLIQQTLAQPAYSHIRAKRLAVTNAFHSSLVDPLIPALDKITEGLKMRDPSIHLERATEIASTGVPPMTVVSEHLRRPVYFHHAVERLADKYPSSVWHEAGSNSTITSMASRALTNAAGHRFQPVNITSTTGIQNLTDTTLALWREGIHLRFWGYHSIQTREYTPMLLPPYQFEKSRHWMDNKRLPASTTMTAPESPTEQNNLFTFLGYQDKAQQIAKFHINTSHPSYVEPVSGHVVASTAPLAPASFLLDIVIEALHTLPEAKGKIPQVHAVTSDAPLCLDPSRTLWIELHATDNHKQTWDIKFISGNPAKGARSQMMHCSARIIIFSQDSSDLAAQFARYTRLISHAHCRDLLVDPNVDDILQGRTIYRAFSEVVDYSAPYRGVTKLVGKGSHSAGHVVKKYTGETWADPYLCDSFSQVGGFWVNCMTDRSSDDIYIASGMEMWMRCPEYADKKASRPENWDVLAMHRREEGMYISDVFVFEPESGKLVEIFLGLQYSKIAKVAFAKILRSLAPGASAASSSEGLKAEDERLLSTGKGGGSENIEAETKVPKKKGTVSIASRVKAVVAEFCAMDPSEIHDDGHMADAGVDSLMAMELAREMEEAFGCTLPATDLMEAETFRDMVKCVQTALGVEDDDSSSSTTEEEDHSEKVIDTPPPSESAATSVSDVPELCLSQDPVLEAFGQVKALTDQFLADNQCSGRVHAFAPLQIQLCVTLTLEAFEELGDAIRKAQPSQRLKRISFDPQHQELVDYLYKRLEEARLIDLDGTTVIRTAIAAPMRSSTAILEEVSREYPEYAGASKLSFFTGSHLASVLRGEQDGLQLIFGTKEGQELVSWMYGDEPHNVSGYKQMLEFIKRLVGSIDTTRSPLKILEMGAGTGGGTKWFLPGLAKLNIPVEYTFTDISAGFVAQARRRFKNYPFVQYRVHDIEKPPADDLLRTQHIIIASNAVHATSNLQQSTRHMRQALRDDGVLMMLEMTRPVFAIDIVFGLFRGWWVFNDGRQHAITNESRWETDLHAVGYGHVDWTDGYSPEVSVQRVIFATASGGQRDRLPLGKNLTSPMVAVDNAARSKATGEYIQRAAERFEAPTRPVAAISDDRVSVLVTGATGSLGCHVVARLVRDPGVATVVCLNRRSKEDAFDRQMQSFVDKEIDLTPQELSKLEVIESNTSELNLGLTTDQLSNLTRTVTHIIHNAWPMNGISRLSAFEPQFKVMRNLIDLARDAASFRTKPIRFQLISSIGTVGHRPLLSGQPIVTEESAKIEWVLPNGYGEAKYICERILDETLHQHPDRFEAMVIRPGQIAGSSVSGYWNSGEHLPAIIKSAQTLKLLPDFRGVVSWASVDHVAGTVVDLLLSTNKPHPVYHIDNPVRQPWKDMITLLADELGVPRSNIVPFAEWIQRVKSFSGSSEDNPAVRGADWLEENFERMSCGGLLLDTSKAREHSSTLSRVGAVSEEVTRGPGKELHPLVLQEPPSTASKPLPRSLNSRSGHIDRLVKAWIVTTSPATLNPGMIGFLE
ncbi:putative polyketide synthase [Aspergillus affinis]|uniref:putative polyketide synthase n=1 Tax=Aspergillus affinis TaxID=1070780 RepID=UPI0022FE2F22|nr:polyketide synthase module [Aspergillus affinis]KAI9045893.1 polyketide synthase module [Aspergillus affinis]